MENFASTSVHNGKAGTYGTRLDRNCPAGVDTPWSVQRPGQNRPIPTHHKVGV
jgi:hypothetical protein